MFVRAAAIAIAVAQPAAAQAPLKAQLDALLTRSYPADGPGATMIVTRGGRTVYAGARGRADIATARALTPDSVIRMGSITKQFTAAVILQLVDEGRIALDDPLSRFYPDYPAPGASVTVRQLLNHTSGIQSYTDIPGWMVPANTARAYTTDALVAQFRDRPAAFPAGARFSYNNSGYVLLGGIIERVTGRPWHVAVTERLTRPLGLTTIRLGNPPAARSWATPYAGGGADAGPAQAVDMTVPGAAGGLVGSVGDLARWSHALHHGRVLPAARYAQMIAPTRLPDGSTEGYGFGIANARLRGAAALTHSGGIFGAATDSVYLPGDDLFVAVFANSDMPQTNPGIVMRRAVAIAAGRPYADLPVVPVDLAAVTPALGVYAIAGGADTRLFYERGGALLIRRGGGAETPVYPAGDGRFSLGGDSLTWFRIVPGPNGAMTMEMHQNGEDTPERAVRTGPAPARTAAITVPRAALAPLVGRYDVRIGIATVAFGTDDTLTVQLGGQPAFPLEPIAPGRFRLVGVEAEVELDGRTMTIHQNGRTITGARAG